MSQIGKWLVFAGAGLAVLGLFVWLAGRAGLPFGRLPGDFRLERGGLSCFIPLASSIIISLLLTVVLNVIIRLLNR